jgi:antitoxin component YwqK of YwqJK toxin-antitoxin module
MKKLILLFTVLAFIGCKEVIIDKDDTTVVDGVLFLKHDMSLATGKVKSYYLDGQLDWEQTYKDGIKNGAVKKWEGGQLTGEGTYKDGKLNGTFKEWSKGGQLISEGAFKDGKYDGVIKSWHEDGQLKREEIFKDGELISTKEWDEDGKRIE